MKMGLGLCSFVEFLHVGGLVILLLYRITLKISTLLQNAIFLPQI